MAYMYAGRAFSLGPIKGQFLAEQSPMQSWTSQAFFLPTSLRCFYGYLAPRIGRFVCHRHGRGDVINLSSMVSQFCSWGCGEELRHFLHSSMLQGQKDNEKLAIPTNFNRKIILSHESSRFLFREGCRYLTYFLCT